MNTETGSTVVEATPDDDKAQRRRLNEMATGGRLLLGWGLLVASVVLLTLGWFGVSGNPLVAVQLPYLMSGGIGGLLAGIAGIGFLVSNDVRRDRERLGRVEAAVLELRDVVAAQAEVIEELAGRGRPGTRAGSRPRRARAPAAASGNGTSLEKEEAPPAIVVPANEAEYPSNEGRGPN